MAPEYGLLVGWRSGRISGPLLDQIDLHIEVPPVTFREITAEQTGENSEQIRERVIAARRRQQERFKSRPRISCNARMTPRELKPHCALDESTMELLKFARADFNLRARAYDRILKGARTIADFGRLGKYCGRPRLRSYPVPLDRSTTMDLKVQTKSETRPPSPIAARGA